VLCAAPAEEIDLTDGDDDASDRAFDLIWLAGLRLALRWFGPLDVVILLAHLPARVATGWLILSHTTTTATSELNPVASVAMAHWGVVPNLVGGWALLGVALSAIHTILISQGRLGTRSGQGGVVALLGLADAAWDVWDVWQHVFG
jgi:hypothetical protein